MCSVCSLFVVVLSCQRFVVSRAGLFVPQRVYGKIAWQPACQQRQCASNVLDLRRRLDEWQLGGLPLHLALQLLHGFVTLRGFVSCVGVWSS